MLSTRLFANENIASTIASNILAGELNPVLRVLCYVPSNKFPRICHLRYRVQDNLICLPSAALRATNFTVWLLSATLYATNFIMCLPSATLRATNYIIRLPPATLRSKLYRVCHLQPLQAVCWQWLRAIAYNVCFAYLRATNIIVCLVSATFNLLPFLFHTKSHVSFNLWPKISPVVHFALLSFDYALVP